MSLPKVYVVVLNYNGWADTLECLESLTNLTYANYQIIVVDNQSTDGSVEIIQEWAAGQRRVNVSLLVAGYQPVRKPLPYVVLRRQQAETATNPVPIGTLVLIETGANLGFAGGNNVALRYVLRIGDADYVWLLNNDTVVEPDSLTHLINYQNNETLGRPGITGAKVRYYHAPQLIQCIGGAYYNRWLGYSRQIGNHQVDRGQFDEERVRPDLIIGACMLVSRSFLEVVGLMNEAYFLYFEEQDWAERARRNQFTLAYTTQAVVYHKEGATIGGGQRKGGSRFSDYYFTRSKLLFTRLYYGKLTQFTVKIGVLLTVLNRLCRRQFDRVPMLLGLLLNPDRPRPATGGPR